MSHAVSDEDRVEGTWAPTTHGPKPRSRHRYLAATAAALAVVVAVGVTVVVTHGSSAANVVGGSDVGRVKGPSAQHLADGVWLPIAPAPFPLCAPTAAWDGTDLIVVDAIEPADKQRAACGIANETGAGIYDPKTNRWTGIAPPPADLGSSILLAWQGARLVAVSTVNSSAASWNRATDVWTVLPPRPDPAYTATSVTTIGANVVVATIGRSGLGHVEQVVGNGWRLLPALPADGQHVAAAAVANLSGVVYAMTTTQPNQVEENASFYGKIQTHLMTLAGDHWRSVSSQANVTNLDIPINDLTMTAVAGKLLVSGLPCPPQVPCTLSTSTAMLIAPGHSVPIYTVSAGTTGFAIAAGGSTVVYQGPRNTSATLGEPTRLNSPGKTTIVDVATGKRFGGPSAGGGASSTLITWTPYGPISFGETANAGLILRPDH